MRRVGNPVPPGGRERGAVSVLVALLMVAFLGFAAVAVDVGMLYAERTQLQNGSDAAALAVAQKCARDVNDPECSGTSSLARSLVNSNAGDGLSNLSSLTLDTAGRTVTVTAGAQEAGSEPNSVSLVFARVLGISSAAVTARSSVAWGSPVKGTTPFPLAFSICQVSGMVEGAGQLVQNHTSNANTDCALGPAGKTVPGGFAWIVQAPGQCGGLVDLAVKQGGSETGNDGPSNCDAVLTNWAAEHAAGKPLVVLFPVYRDVSGTGSGASYDLVAFAALRVTGWRFSGSDKLPLVYNNAPATGPQCKGDCRGIIGQFVKYVSLADGYALGPPGPYGATVVELIP